MKILSNKPTIYELVSLMISAVALSVALVTTAGGCNYDDVTAFFLGFLGGPLSYIVVLELLAYGKEEKESAAAEQARKDMWDCVAEMMKEVQTKQLHQENKKQS